MIEAQLFANKMTGEELSLSIIDNGHEDEDGGTFDCVIEIKRKLIVSKAAKEKSEIIL